MNDWEQETGVPWGATPIGVQYPAPHHFRNGDRIVGQDGPWRLRDRIARAIGYHCFECWRSTWN